MLINGFLIDLIYTYQSFTELTLCTDNPSRNSPYRDPLMRTILWNHLIITLKLFWIKKKLTCSLIVVDIDALELQVRVPMVGASRVDTVLVRYHLPELKIYRHMTLIVSCTTIQTSWELRSCKSILSLWCWNQNIRVVSNHDIDNAG